MLPKTRIENKEVESIITYEELIDTIETALYSCKIGQSNMASEGHIYTDNGDLVSMLESKH